MRDQGDLRRMAHDHLRDVQSFRIIQPIGITRRNINNKYAVSEGRQAFQPETLPVIFFQYRIFELLAAPRKNDIKQEHIDEKKYEIENIHQQ